MIKEETIQYLNQIFNQQNGFSEKLRNVEMRKPQVKMNKPVYIGFSILELIKFKCNSYGMIILKKNIIKKVSFVLLIQISL